MADTSDFAKTIADAYATTGPALELGLVIAFYPLVQLLLQKGDLPVLLFEQVGVGSFVEIGAHLRERAWLRRS